MGAKIITYTILKVPDYNYCILAPYGSGRVGLLDRGSAKFTGLKPCTLNP